MGSFSANFFHITFPTVYVGVMEKINEIASVDLTSVIPSTTCMFERRKNLFVFSLLLMTVGPIVFIACVALVVWIANQSILSNPKLSARTKETQILHNLTRLTHFFFIFTFLIFAGSSSTVMAGFQYDVELYNNYGVCYLVADYSTICDRHTNPTYNFIFIYCAIFLFIYVCLRNA